MECWKILQSCGCSGTWFGAAVRSLQAVWPSSVLCAFSLHSPPRAVLGRNPQASPPRRRGSQSLVLHLDRKEARGLFHVCSTWKSGSCNVTRRGPAPLWALPCGCPCVRRRPAGGLGGSVLPGKAGRSRCRASSPRGSTHRRCVQLSAPCSEPAPRCFASCSTRTSTAVGPLGRWRRCHRPRNCAPLGFPSIAESCGPLRLPTWFPSG